VANVVDEASIIPLQRTSIVASKGTICGSLVIILFDSDFVHIYANKLI
jgi:hypothetical protein